jgi:hypothetical protein
MPRAPTARKPSCWPWSTRHETDRNLDLVLAEFPDYLQGILPVGPGARSLTAFFASIDTEITAGSPSRARLAPAAADPHADKIVCVG